MIKKIFPPVLVIALAACGSSPNDRVVSYAVERVTIVDVDMPKHFHVDVRLENGAIARGVARSKRCAHARERAIVGATFTIPVSITQSGARYPDYDALRDLICH